jgi:nicotinamide-nucleotide amidase
MNDENELKHLDKTVTDVLQLLKKEKLRISFAESCTGGLLSRLLTANAGASEVYELGVCTYSNRMKTKLLGVSPELLDSYGAVSPETAQAMAEGLHKLSGADICVSVTGIAGPGGGTPQKPVGTVYSGIFLKGECRIHRFNSDGGRIKIQIHTAMRVYELLKGMI